MSKKDSWGKVKNILGLDNINEDELDDEMIEELERLEEEGQVSRPIMKSTQNKTSEAPAKDGSKVLVVEPEFFNDAPVICDNLKNNKTVVVNLENTDYEDGRKIFDFLNGAVYALSGTIQKISENVFILAPSTVDVITDDIETESAHEFLDWNYEK